MTVISEWLAITAKHCGKASPFLQLNVQTTSDPGSVGVRKIEVNPDMDVEAIFLCCRTGLGVTPHSGFVTTHNPLSFWGYGDDNANNETNWLTRAEFDGPRLCPGNVLPENGNLCWETTATNSVCIGDSGGPILQNGAIIGMFTKWGATRNRPDGTSDCSSVVAGQAISVQQMRYWLDQMITDSNPFD